jgi:hypothetical protein
MSEPTDDEYAAYVDRIVDRAQRLDDVKQRIRADIRAQGGDPDEARIIVGYSTDSSEYRADELQRPRWMDERPNPGDD